MKDVNIFNLLRDWKQFDVNISLESGEHGVIFVSFGSVVKASKMPEAKRKAMLAVFSRLKQRVIWKWEEPMEDAPSNVLVSSWLPQTSLLADPRVKLFITHGGAGSIQETVCHKTPIVGVPIGSDQFLNVAEVVGKGVGQQVGWHGMTEDSLHTAVTEVLGDSSYQEAVTRLRYSHPHNYKGTKQLLDVPSDLVMDQATHPLERAVWWLEYLLRHPHNPDMRPVTHGLHWTQFFLLDVIVVVLLAITVLGVIIVKLVRCCCCSRKRKQD